MSDKELQGLKNIAEQMQKDAAQRIRDRETYRSILDAPLLTTPEVHCRFDKLAHDSFGTPLGTFAEVERPFWHDDCLPTEGPR